MSRTQDPAQGLGNSRNWAAFPAADGPTTWSLAGGVEFLKGPLPLEDLRGQRVAVFLDEGQYGFLTRDGDLQAVYLDGGHYLDVGKMPGQVHPDSRLFLLAADRPIVLRWTDRRPLELDALPGPGIIGSCTLAVAAPKRFYETFLRPSPDGDEGRLATALDQAVRASLADLVVGADLHGATDPGTLQATLTRLSCDDLGEDLADQGLNCTQLAVYTASPPVEAVLDTDSGQFSELVHT